MDKKETAKCHCNKCGQSTNHTTIFQKEIRGYGERHSEHDGLSWSDTYSLLECCGCREFSFKVLHWFSDYDDTWEDYYPPRVSRRRPDWFEELPQEYFPLLDEI